jgi:hypothetical protein
VTTITATTYAPGELIPLTKSDTTIYDPGFETLLAAGAGAVATVIKGRPNAIYTLAAGGILKDLGLFRQLLSTGTAATLTYGIAKHGCIRYVTT